MKTNDWPKIGDDVVCIKECIMHESGTKTTTLNKIYRIYKSGEYNYSKCIIDDCEDYHYFSNAWDKYFRPVRKEKLIKLNILANGNEK